MGQCQIWRSKHLGMCNCKDMLANDVELLKKTFRMQSHERFSFLCIGQILFNPRSCKKKINAWYCFSIKLLNNMRCMTTRAVFSRKIRGFCVVTMHVLCKKNKYLWIDYTNSIVHEDKGCFVLFGVFWGEAKHAIDIRSQNVFFLISR